MYDKRKQKIKTKPTKRKRKQLQKKVQLRLSQMDKKSANISKQIEFPEEVRSEQQAEKQNGNSKRRFSESQKV